MARLRGQNLVEGGESLHVGDGINHRSVCHGYFVLFRRLGRGPRRTRSGFAAVGAAAGRRAARRRFREQSFDPVQLGIHVVQTHFHVGEPFRQSDEVHPAGHAELLQRLQHGLLHRVAEGRGYRQVRIHHAAGRLGVGFGIDGLHHGLGPHVEITIPHLPQGAHGIELRAIAGCIFGHCKSFPRPGSCCPQTAEDARWVNRGLPAIYKPAVYNRLTATVFSGLAAMSSTFFWVSIRASRLRWKVSTGLPEKPNCRVTLS